MNRLPIIFVNINRRWRLYVEEVKDIHKKRTDKKNSALGELLQSLIIAILLATVIRLFVMSPFFIPSPSMVPTLQIGDRIIVSKMAYYFHPPQRGDVMVFKYPVDPSKDYVKRLIAVGGEVIALKNSKLYINGYEVPENYLPPGLRFSDYGPVRVPQGKYFMLGDNRNNSSDSRFWSFLPENLIIGKAVFVYWPLDRIGLVR